jgi:hypothetical protein
MFDQDDSVTTAGYAETAKGEDYGIDAETVNAVRHGSDGEFILVGTVGGGRCAHSYASGMYNKAHAEYIANAVRNHDALLQAARCWVEYMQVNHMDADNVDFVRAYDAVAKAEGV